MLEKRFKYLNEENISQKMIINSCPFRNTGIFVRQPIKHIFQSLSLSLRYFFSLLLYIQNIQRRQSNKSTQYRKTRRQGTSLYISLIKQHDVCLFVCLSSISSGTAGPIWPNFFCQLRLGHGMVLGQKNSGSGIRFFRKSGKKSGFQGII